MNQTTTWILDMIDRITEPMRSIGRATDETGEAVDDLQDRVRLGEKETIAALNNEKAHRSDLNKKLKEQEGNLKDLEKQIKKSTGAEFQKIEHDIEKATASIKDFKEGIKLADEDIKQLGDDVEHFKKESEKWQGIATGANQLTEIFERTADSLDFATEIANIQSDIQQMTGTTGQELEDLTGIVHRLGKQWNQSDEEISRSANALAKQMDISYGDALAHIEAGFQKGANLNGDMLDQLKEYGPQMKDAGLSAAQGIALMAQAGKAGIFSDKAIDAVKEAGLSLREMGQPQIDALHGIGIEVKDLAGKTTFEAIQMVSKAMEGASVQARQLALTDIFKGAGEDAGMGFVLGLGSVDMDLNNIPSVQAAGASINGFFADVQTWVATGMGAAAGYMSSLGDLAAGVVHVNGMLQLFKSTQLGAAISSKALTAATWLWNIALDANPIGIVVLAIAALVGGIVLLSKHFDWANGIVAVFSDTWKDWGGVILDFVLFPLNQVMGVLKAIWLLMQGDFSGAMAAITKPAEDMANDVKEAADKSGKTYDKAKNDFNTVSGTRADYEKEKGILHIDDPNKKSGTLDGVIQPPKSGKKGGAGGDGMSISGSGGNKTISVEMEIKNYFNGISSKLDVREVANEVAGIINDRMRDTLLAQI